VVVEPQEHLILRESLPLVHLVPHRHSLLHTPAPPSRRPTLTFQAMRAARRGSPVAITLKMVRHALQQLRHALGDRAAKALGRRELAR
jgi:hypothetical protein